ncbi:unnamed protein product [Symbiodinium natans]|uniref:Uncharacterized protein n=1 Tax=Symbiodinium natans TaxID=878477 RepID=A0A812SLA5_9DINO|nr:unnamed protein product [Symbiodinium natans]
MCASKEQAKALYELQTKKIQPTVPMTVDASNPCLKKFETLLDQSNVVFANGGNPDIYGFVVKKFAPQLGELIRKRVQEGTLLYMGRSAGGMVGGSDFALTYEPSPALTSSLLNEDTRGLALAGKCALRPHIKNHLWDITSKIYAKATGQTVVLAANGEGLFCNQGCCGMTGTTEKTDPDSIKNAGYSASRIQKAYQAAYSGASEPTKFYDKAQAAEAKCGETSGKVVLTSNGLESAASQQAFVTLLKKDPSTVKVVSLDDGAYLSKGFWDATDAEFAKVGGVNYLTLQTPTAPSMVQEATQGFQGLVPGSGSTADTSLQTLGVSPTSISHISAFDRCASQEQKQALFALESQGVPPKVPMEADANCVSKLVGELASADVVVMGDGNADFLSFVYKKFAPSLGQALVDRVTSGNSVFLGLGGGSTFASASTMAAGSTGSKILKTLLQDNMEGLGLAGSCAVRPGFNPSVAWWDMTSALFEDATKMDFVGLEDGAALVCSGQCAVSGSETASKMMGADSGSLHRGRVHMILDNALD